MSVRGWAYAVAFAWFAATVAQAQEAAPPSDPVLGTRIVAGEVANSRLWLLGRNSRDQARTGGLVSFDLESGQRDVALADGVAAVARDADGEIIALREFRSPRQTGSGRSYTLLRGPEFASSSAPALVLRGDDVLLTLVAASSQTLAVSRQHVFILPRNGVRWRTLDVSPAIDFSVQTSAALVDGALYVGINRGEWGGGVRRIDLGTEETTNIQRVDDGSEICGSPLDSDCDPVTGMVVDPTRPNCILASVGLAHMLWHGRLLRICGSRVELLFEQPVDASSSNTIPGMTEPLFGLVRSGEDVWAVTPRALYRFSGDAPPQRIALPSIEQWHGLGMARNVPGLVVLRTDVNWEVSVSGYTPLLVSTH